MGNENHTSAVVPTQVVFAVDLPIRRAFLQSDLKRRMKNILMLLGLVAILLAACQSKEEKQAGIEQICAKYYTFPMDLDKNQKNDMVRKVFEATYKSWNEGDTLNAIARAQEFLSRNPTVWSMMYLNANMFYASGDYNTAARAFDDLRKNNTYREKAGFYRAMALINLGQVDEGKALLQTIADEAEHGHAADASALLNEL